MIRAFITVELPDPLREEVAALQAELRSAGADVKWVEPENLHLTLKFLGDIEESQVAPLTEALRSSTLHHSPFTISLEGIGAFPKTALPRVVWVGVTQGMEELTRLAEAVERACQGLGFSAGDRPFSAHLTLGRVRSRDRVSGLVKKLQLAEFRGGTPATVNRLILFQSVLSPKGPAYTLLAEIPFTPP